MIKNVFFWGAKYKAGIIYDLIINDKITENTKNLSVKYLFDPNLEDAIPGSLSVENWMNKFNLEQNLFLPVFGNNNFPQD